MSVLQLPELWIRVPAKPSDGYPRAWSGGKCLRLLRQPEYGEWLPHQSHEKDGQIRITPKNAIFEDPDNG